MSIPVQTPRQNCIVSSQNTGCSSEALLNLITHSGGMGFRVKDTRGLTLDELVNQVGGILTWKLVSQG